MGIALLEGDVDIEGSSQVDISVDGNSLERSGVTDATISSSLLPIGADSAAIEEHYVVDVSQVFEGEREVQKSAEAQESGSLGQYAFAVNAMVQRANLYLTRVLLSEGLSVDDIARGIEEGIYRVLSREDVLDKLDRAQCGIMIQGGGDCAGIADCTAALAEGLNEELSLLGVKNSGKGLAADPEGFRDSLVVVDPLLIEDLRGQSSAPFGSSRVDPLKTARENTLANLDGHKFFAATGGNDHGGLAERIAKEFPDMISVWGPKTIDGDVSAGDFLVQSLGFDSAWKALQDRVWNIAQSAATHGEVTVVEAFGRDSGRLAFEAARHEPSNLSSLNGESARKIVDFKDMVRILVPERPVSFQQIIDEVKTVKDKKGSCTLVVAEGFLPPELKYAMKEIAHNDYLRERWLAGTLSLSSMPTLVLGLGDDEAFAVLAKLLSDQGLAMKFAKMIWEGKRDAYGNGVKLSGIRHFMVEALKVLGAISKVNEELVNRDLRGINPSEYDSLMGKKMGAKMAELVNGGVTGGKAVVFLEGMDVMVDDPVVLPLDEIGDKNNLNSVKYPDSLLRRNGVVIA